MRKIIHWIKTFGESDKQLFITYIIGCLILAILPLGCAVSVNNLIDKQKNKYILNVTKPSAESKGL